MKASNMYIQTLKETPKEAEIKSHVYLLRSSYIKKLVSGVYTFMPLGLKLLSKIEKVIKEEMDRSGSQEILCSALQPKELWEESGRYSKYGPELMRLKDRNERDFCLGPTHEEIFTSIVRDYARSYKLLPITLYQIQTKYRDEMRPRFGLLRSREFIMKDAYSFDTSYEGSMASYDNMMATYKRIFDRLKLDYKIVLADTGAIGGSMSHQFMALSEIGESTIIYNDSYAADQEKAEAMPDAQEKEELKNVEVISTPNVKTIEDLSSFLNISPKRIIKCVCYKDLKHNQIVVCALRGDREVNEAKVVNRLDIAEHELVALSIEDAQKASITLGFVGPDCANALVLIDKEVTFMYNSVCGGNAYDTHKVNVNFSRDFTGEVLDLRMVVAGDKDVETKSELFAQRGIEVGQLFFLGTKYSSPMSARFVDRDGKEKDIVMGCYGIGVTRSMQAMIEKFSNEEGILLPEEFSPYKYAIIPVKYDGDMKDCADKLYEKLQSKYDCVLDDRDMSFGAKMKDFELIGVPYLIVCGRDSKDGKVELVNRYTKEKTVVSIDSIN